jgi:hypothetical protein
MSTVMHRLQKQNFVKVGISFAVLPWLLTFQSSRESQMNLQRDLVGPGVEVWEEYKKVQELKSSSRDSMKGTGDYFL